VSPPPRGVTYFQYTNACPLADAVLLDVEPVSFR
jgi:hypothetical protein